MVADRRTTSNSSMSKASPPPGRLVPEQDITKYTVERVMKSSQYAQEAIAWNSKYRISTRKITPVSILAYSKLKEYADEFLDYQSSKTGLSLEQRQRQMYQEQIQYFERKLYNSQKAGFPRNNENHQIEEDVNILQQCAILARYGDWATRWWRDIQATSVRLCAEQRIPASDRLHGDWVANIDEKLRDDYIYWYNMYSDAKEGEANLRKANAPVTNQKRVWYHLKEVAGRMGLSVDYILRVMRFYTEENRTDHSDMRDFLRNGRLHRAAEAMWNDYHYIARNWPCGEPQYRTMLMHGIQRQVKAWFNTEVASSYWETWYQTATTIWYEDCHAAGYRTDADRAKANEQERRALEKADAEELEDMFRVTNRRHMIKILFANKESRLPDYALLNSEYRMVVDRLKKHWQKEAARRAASIAKTKERTEGEEKGKTSEEPSSSTKNCVESDLAEQINKRKQIFIYLLDEIEIRYRDRAAEEWRLGEFARKVEQIEKDMQKMERAKKSLKDRALQQSFEIFDLWLDFVNEYSEYIVSVQGVDGEDLVIIKDT